MNTTAWRLAWIGLVGLWGFALWSWSGLPEMIPTHLDLEGRPDAWAERSVLRWYGVPLCTTALLGLMAWLGRWAPRHPEHVNLPGADRILALPERFHGPFHRLPMELLGWVSLEMVVIFWLVQYSMYRTSQGLSTEGTLLVIIGVGVMSSPILLALISLRTQKVVDEAVKRARAEGVIEE